MIDGVNRTLHSMLSNRLEWRSIMAAAILKTYDLGYRQQRELAVADNQCVILRDKLSRSDCFIHISGHPSATYRAQDRESSPVKSRRSTTVYLATNQLSGSFVPKIISYLNLSKLRPKYCQSFVFLTCCIEFALNLYTFLLRQNDWHYMYLSLKLIDTSIGIDSI